MVRRSLGAVFVGGAYVFPGGAVDPADGGPEVESVCEGRSDAAASATLELDSGGLAFWVAAVRECFEEAGVLLAHRAALSPGAASSLVSLADPSVAERFAAHRADLWAGRRGLVEVCEQEGLRLAVDRLHYFSHWITPTGAPRRFDTRFFVAAAPEEQVPLHDEAETIASMWVRPGDALARFEAGELEMIHPTIENLKAIARFDCSADLLAAAEAIGAVPTVMPRVRVGRRGRPGPAPLRSWLRRGSEPRRRRRNPGLSRWLIPPREPPRA